MTGQIRRSYTQDTRLRHPRTDRRKTILVVAGPRAMWDGVLTTLYAVGTDEALALAGWLTKEIEDWEAAP